MFSKKFFEGNRQRLMAQLPDALIVIAAHEQLQESADLAFQFRQDSSFWYLSGLSISGALLVMDTKKNSTTLMMPDQNDYQKVWEGEVDETDIKDKSGVKAVRFKSDLHKLLKDARASGLSICYLAPMPEIVEPYGFYSNPARRNLESAIKKVIKEPEDIRLQLARLRQIKQPEELQAIQKAIDITRKTLDQVKSRLQSFKTEKELERAVSAGFFAHGGDGHAYTPIIAAGKNAAVIHYEDSSAVLSKRDLLLLDVGSKVEGYAADISRVWAVGKPTEKQTAVYEAVIDLQQQAFQLLGPGVLLKEYQQQMETHAAKAMKKLGWPESKYPHGFSHFLGLDVHDAGDYDSPLMPGSVLTVEPGLYSIKEHIGVRIEDNIVITENGIRNLSESIPKAL